MMKSKYLNVPVHQDLCLFFICLFLSLIKLIIMWSTSQIIKEIKSHHVNFTYCRQDVEAVHFIWQLLSVIFWLVSLILGNYIWVAHFWRWKTLQGLELERDLWLTAWSEKKAAENLLAWLIFHLFCYSIADQAVSLLRLWHFAFDYFTWRSRGALRLGGVEEICLIRLTNHYFINLNTPQKAEQNVESHAAAQPTC